MTLPVTHTDSVLGLASLDTSEYRGCTYILATAGTTTGPVLGFSATEKARRLHGGRPLHWPHRCSIPSVRASYADLSMLSVTGVAETGIGADSSGRADPSPHSFKPVLVPRSAREQWDDPSQQTMDR